MSKLDTTPLIDLAAVVLAPVLVMGMLGSFVLFVIEVAYQGDYSARLVWTFFFTVFGAVLIARISITEGRTRARMFGGALGLAAFVAMLRFVEYPPGAMQLGGPLLNLALIALVLFAADRLTWDCTHFDPARKASGRGVLAAAGFDRREQPEEDDEEWKPRQGWLERYEAYRKRRAARPHTPGVTILYFALAALPLFAIGQSLVPVEDGATRRATLFYMAVYIGSALGLLVTTSLMGLRKYLEERGARVPAALTFGWLGLGAGLIVMFLAVGAVLPRPHSETPLVRLGSQSGDRSASRYAAVRDSSAGKGKGAESTKQEEGGNKQGKAGEPKGPGGEKDGAQGKGKSKSQGDSQGKESEARAKGEQAKGNEQKSDGGAKSESRDDESSPASKVGEVAAWASGLLAKVVRVLVILAVIAGAIYMIVKGLAPFTAWARGLLDWWRGLFGRREASASEAADEELETVAPVPFSAFTDPFADGRARGMPAAELAALTFAALEAWGAGHGLPRGAGETAREYATRLGNRFEDLEEVGYEAAELHDRAGYSPHPVVRGELRAFAALWAAMRADAPR